MNRNLQLQNGSGTGEEASAVQTEQTSQTALSANAGRNKRSSQPSPTHPSNASSADPSANGSPQKRIKITASHVFERNLSLFRQDSSSPRTRPLTSSLELPRRHEGQKSLELHLSASLPELPVKYFRAKMAFGFSQAGGRGPQAHAAPDLEEIQTEAVGFSAIAGESKLRLLPTPWPSDALPPPTSSLLNVASRKGLLAAAGPESLIIASTESVRHSFSSDGPSPKSFTPQLSIPVPRVSQVVFTADEQFLVISAQSGGGLAVYEVDNLLQGRKSESFQLATNGLAVRALVPNPAMETAEFLVAVTEKGQLMLANLKVRELVRTANGPVLKENVSCVSWSAKGKQLIAGLGDGTAHQMKPDGSNTAIIPRPPNLNGGIYVSSIYWLANDDFLVVYLESSPSQDSPPDSAPFLVHREKGTSSYSFHKLPDPCPPFGMHRYPPHHFIARLRDFAPNLNDVLIVASTAAGDVGLFTRSEVPLSSDLPADKITNTYTTTTMAVDSRRAQLPVSEEMTDTSPIGVALDLSSKDKVTKPIPTEEMDQSSTPLPNVMILNHEGVLCSWWFVHNESVRQGTAYPGLVAINSPQPQAQTAAQKSPFGAATSSTLGSAAPKSAPPAFGASTFGASGGAFGAPSSFNANKSPWGGSSSSGVGLQAGAASTFGKPAFGSAAPMGGMGPSSFGAAASLGSRASPWSKTDNNSNNNDTLSRASTFGRSASNVSGINVAAANSFSSFGSTVGDSSPFANLTNKPSASPFSAFGQQVKSEQPAFAASSPFGSGGGNNSLFSKTTEPSFGSTVTMDSSAGGSTVESGKSLFSASATNGASTVPSSQLFSKSGTDSKTEMADANNENVGDYQKENGKPQSFFGAKPGGFNLTSTFKGDESAMDDLFKPDLSKDTTKDLFGTGFGEALKTAIPQEPTTPVKKEPGSEVPNLENIPATPSSPPPPSETKQADAPPAVTEQTKPKAEDNEDEQQKATVPNKNIEPAPFPPSPKPLKSTPNDIPPLSGSPEISVEAPSSPLSSGAEEKNTAQDNIVKEEENEQEEQEESDGEDEEDSSDSEVDPGREDSQQVLVEPEEAPLPPDPFPSQSTKSTGADWSFESVPKSPERSIENSPAVASLQQNGQSTTPSGFPKSTPAIPLPPQAPESPRSPSPATSAPTATLKSAPKQSLAPASKATSRIKPKRVPTPPQQKELSDDEDEQIRAELSAEPIPTLQLAPFLAHQDYVGKVAKEGIPGQVERVYRDINSMIDTLGLNAKSVSAFIKGHGKRPVQQRHTKEDLTDNSLWRLGDLENFELLDTLAQNLESGRLRHPRDKLNALSVIILNLRRLRSHANYNRRALQAHINRSETTSTNGDSKSHRIGPNNFPYQTTPLPPDATAQQMKLRRAAAALQKQLSTAEEAVTVLRAQLATTEGGNGGPLPTADAVATTIRKMTALAAQKSADIDWLETQLRRFGLTRPSTAASASASPAPEGKVHPLTKSDGTFGADDKPGVAQPHTPPPRRPGASMRSSVGASNNNNNNNNTTYSARQGRGQTPFQTPPAYRTPANSFARPTPLSSSWSSGTAASAKTRGTFYTPDEGRTGSRSRSGSGIKIRRNVNDENETNSGDGKDAADDVDGLDFSRIRLGPSARDLRAKRAKRRFVVERMKEVVEREGVRVTSIQ